MVPAGLCGPFFQNVNVRFLSDRERGRETDIDREPEREREREREREDERENSSVFRQDAGDPRLRVKAEQHNIS